MIILPSRFGLTVLALSLALLAATVAVGLRGEQTALAPVDVAPAPGAAATSTGASLHIRFARAMKPRSVEERLRLDPPVEGSFRWAGKTLIFTPSRPLQPASEYTATLAAGIEEERGRRSQQPYSWRFRTRAPVVLALQPVAEAGNLVAIDPAGGAPRPLTREPVDVVDFSLAPDGRRAVYTRQDSPVRTSLWLVDLESGATVPFAPDEAASLSAPVWSPTGDLIVFERRQAVLNATATPKLFAARADGGPSSLVYGRGDEAGFGARWAPDGARLAYFDPLKPAVIVFNFTRELVNIPVQTPVSFSWAPDGRHLVIEDIIAEHGAFRHVLVIVDTATGRLDHLSTDSGVDDAAPTWSPDGAWIGFTRRPRVGTIGGAQPWLIRPDGRDGRPLLAAEPAQETFRLAWSPDGRNLVLERASLDGLGGDTQLWLAPIMGDAAPRRLGQGSAATWQP